MKLNRTSLIIMLFACAVAAGADAQTPGLTLRQAISSALGQNPQGAIARADEKDAQAAAALARTELLPQINFTEDISRGNDPVYVFGERLRERQFTQADFALNALNRSQPIGNFSSRFSGSWQAFDSFRTQKQIRRADLFKASAAAAAGATDQQIVLQVVNTYQAVLYAQRKVDVEQHEELTAESLLAQTEARVKAGLAVESDRMAAQVNLSALEEELIAARGELDLGWADLREAMGAPDQPESALTPLDVHQFPDTSLAEEMALAARMRPDLAAIGDTQKGQAEAVSAERAGFGPRVSAYGNWEEDRGSLASSGGNNWVAGVQISVDVLPLGKRDELARANAGRQRADAQMAQARSRVRLDVSRAHIQRETAELSLATARAARDQSAESLRILRNRYNAGLSTITDLLRAEDAERESQSNYWRAVYGDDLAYVQLLFAEGVLTPDAVGELE